MWTMILTDKNMFWTKYKFCSKAKARPTEILFLIQLTSYIFPFLLFLLTFLFPSLFNFPFCFPLTVKCSGTMLPWFAIFPPLCNYSRFQQELSDVIETASASNSDEEVEVLLIHFIIIFYFHIINFS
jgi:hypothetical protein